MINVGEKAPDFALPDQDSKEIKLNEFKGKNIILAFYPFDFSPVCTVEFGCFQDDLGELSNLNAQVIGISVDSKHAHKEFAEKLNLSFPLLSDFSKEVCRLYGTLRPEGFSERAYFLIDKDGIVRFRKIMPSPGERMENGQIIEQIRKIS